ncbi:MAG: PIN domain-containing protein [Bryobacterales bacterium]
MADLWIVRSVFLLVFVLVCFHMRPFGLEPIPAVLFGIAAGCAIVVFEVRLRRVSLKRLIGAAIGSVLGILGALMMSLVLGASLGSPSAPFLQLGVLLLMTYVGLVVGGAKGDMLNLGALGGLFGGEKAPRKSQKILDTSVIIDGRIADVAETGFLDGVLVVPQFVLWELQLVADSADSLKRNRGRRGLDILQRLQKIVNLDVQIIETDYPKIKEVDQKLIHLARDTDAKIVTNDFNLNKLAQLQGVQVLNINELANALKPIVLPGETMKVFILKEGKEYNQGVAYLDDGTMVVVDNARRYISKTVEISVTSVLQTTAGKMIFGRYDERHQNSGQERPVALQRGVAAPPAAPQKIEQTAGR